MLCESKARIGFLGACFFIGVLVASTVVPVGLLADIYGRKWIFVGTLIVLIVACVGFIYAKSLEELYVYMFLLGTTFPGRIIVGINYAQEFQKESWVEYIQPFNQAAQGITLILTAFYFQFISKHIFYIEVTHVAFVCYMLIQTIWAFPESPRYNYSKDKFIDAKENL
jgi:MFS family permease